MKPYNGDKPYIFISYAHKNINRVMSIVERMNIDGYRMWYDEGIDPGNEWADNIATKISNSTCLIAMISTDYLKSENCKDEISYAREKDVRILLLYIEDVELSGGLALRNHRMQSLFQCGENGWPFIYIYKIQYRLGENRDTLYSDYADLLQSTGDEYTNKIT